jgi:pimeloyl-ACP methyl ester carboxylesterase
MRRYQGLLAGLETVILLGCGVRKPAQQATASHDSSPHQVRFIAAAPGVSLEVLDWGGHGAPIVFLSGLQDVAHGFDDFAPQFTDANRVVAITRRGYGASSQPPSGYDLATRVADLRAILDSLALSRVVLVGHSIAGDELTAFGGQYPERVAGLIYLDAAYDHSNLTSILGDYPVPPPMTAEDSASPYGVQSYLLRAYQQHISIAQLTAIGHYDSTGHLRRDVTPPVIDSLMLAGCGHPDYSRVQAPVLAIDAVVDSAPQLFPLWATMDSATKAQAIRFADRVENWSASERARFRTGIPTARLLELHGANHYVFDSNRAEVVAAMREFLAQHRSPS